MEATKTLAAVDADTVVEAAPRQGHRNHLGASVIGRTCARELWYIFRWCGTEQVPPRILRLFRRGDREEFEFVHRLTRIGIQFHWPTEQGAEGQQWRMTAHHGHFGGSLDGILTNVPDVPNDWTLGEFKTYNEKQFDKLTKDGLCRAKFEHFGQMQVYMNAYGLRVGLYCAVCKNDDRLYLELVQNDGMTAKRLHHKAEQIIWSQTPPPRIHNSPGRYGCRFCAFKKLCFQPQQAAPERNCRSCKWARPSVDASWWCGCHQYSLRSMAPCDHYERIA